ncbi:MAG: DUF4340 domain-containing protein [Limisphaerales bacterium]
MIRKDTAWLMAIAVFAVGYLLLFEREHTEEAPTGPVLLPAFDSGKIESIEITYNGTNTIRAARSAGQWHLEHPLPYPAMPEGPNKLISQLQALTPLNYRQTMGAPEEFGFAPPRVAIRLELPDQDIELQLGDFTPLEDKLYARTPGQPGVFTVSRQFLNFLPFTANFWRDQHLLHLSRSNQLEVDHIQIKSGPRQLTLQQTTNEIWRISQPPPTKRANKTFITKTLINLWNWNVVEFVSDDPRVDLQPYGLQSPEAELVLSRGTNRLAAVQFGHSPTNQPGMVYARLLQHTNVVIVPKPWLTDLRAPIWDYSDHHLVDTFDPGAASLQRINITAGDTFTLEQSTNGLWQINSPSQLPADENLVFALLGRLRNMEAVSREREVVGDFSAFGLAQPTAQYTLLQRGGTNAILGQISFGAPAGEASGELFARRFDEDSVYRVRAVDHQSLPAYSYQLRQRRFWEFPVQAVTKITLTQGEQSLELLRNQDGEWTRTGQPLTKDQREKIPTALGALGRLHAARWTARGADKLATYEIIQRKKSVTLELQHNGQTLTRKIQFGKQSELFNFFAFATDPLEQEAVVFECPLNTYNACEIILFPLLTPVPPNSGTDQ